MPFTITYASGSSNKNQTLAWNAVSKVVEEAQAGSTPGPFIDRLSATLKVPAIQLGKDIWGAFNESCRAFGDLHKVKPSKGYNRALRVELPSVLDRQKWPFLELFASDGVVERLRIDLIPADLQLNGMHDLHDALQNFIPDGWAFFIEHGRISRLDVTADFSGLVMADMLVVPPLSVTTMQWSRAGNLESYQLGKARGSHTMIYDRKAKRIAQKKSWQGKEGVRVERRLKGQSMRFVDLPSLNCVFEGLGLVSRKLPPPESVPGHHWEMFLLASCFAGSVAALAKLPVAERTKYRQHLNQNLVSPWDLPAIWSHWPSYLAELNICNKKAWL